MKLENKKNLAARVLGIGKGRVSFNNTRLTEIKEAITNQDIRDLAKDGAIIIKPVVGRKKIVRSNKRRTPGKIRMKVVDTKRRYITITRRLRRFLFQLRNTKRITEENYQKLRREIRASNFKNMAHFKERLTQL